MTAAGQGRAGWQLPWVLVVGGLLVGGGCRRSPAVPAHAAVAAVAVDAGPIDAAAADRGARAADQPANLLLTAEYVWTQQEDRDLAREILRRALVAISQRQGSAVQVVAALAQGLADPNYVTAPRAEVALSAGTDRLAIAHGRLLSVVELHGLGRTNQETNDPLPLFRLAESPAAIRRVVFDRDGERIATLADDGIVRLRYVNGDPGAQWPLLSPRAPAPRELPGHEAAYRASWLDFSPDARFLFLADCGVTTTADCPLRRLRAFTTDRGLPLPTFTSGERELIDYTARRDGSVAVLFAGDPPRLYQTSTGNEIPLTSDLGGGAAQACLGGTRPPKTGERGWLVSADRRWLATLAAPTTLCLWDLSARQLIAAVNLTGSGLATLRLESLLCDQAAYTVVVSTAERSGGRRTYLLDPHSGQRTAELAGGVVVMPLDDGGALLSGHQRGGPQRGALQLQRLNPGGQLVRLPGAELQSLRCLADFPDAVEGGGGLALFAPLDPAASPDCPLALIELALPPRTSVRLRRLTLPGNVPIAAATFVGPLHQLVITDATAQVQVLTGAQLQPTIPPAAAAVTRLSFAPGTGEQLVLGTADGQTTELWITGGTLHSLTATPGNRRPPSEKADPPPAVSEDAQLRGALEPVKTANPHAPRVLSLRTTAGSLRWQVPLGDLPPVTALAFTPDGRFLLVGGAGGTVAWLRIIDGGLRLRLQLVPGGAVALASDGRFELLGEVEHPEHYVFCRAGSYQIPLSLCTSRLRTRGLLSAALSP